MKLDFNEIKQTVSMEKAVAFLGLVVTRRESGGTQLRCACPRCKPDGERELSISTTKNLFTCFASKPSARGDVIAMVAHVKDIGQREAAELLHAAFLQEPEKPKTRKSGRKATKPDQKSSNVVVGGTVELEQWETFIARL